MQELQNLRTGAEKFRECTELISKIDVILAARAREAQSHKQADRNASALKAKFVRFQNLTARELVTNAEELTATEIADLLKWEKSNKNRALVIRELSALLVDDSEATAPKPSGIVASSTGKTFAGAPNPYEAENQKIMKRGKGTLRLICIECGALNYVDMANLREVIERRNNTRAGRLSAWSDRQIQGGSRMTGRHEAAELSRANQMAIAQQVQKGFPCTSCQTPMLS